MKKLIYLLLLITSIASFSQIDSVKIDDKYLDDQLYLFVTYNVLVKQPEKIGPSGFSYGLAFGFIRDIPFNKARNIGIGLGLGYEFDSFNHNYDISDENNDRFLIYDRLGTSSNKLRMHSLAIPLEFRIRTSTKTKYSFWRLYFGAQLSYNFSNKFSFYHDSDRDKYKQLSFVNPWQTGLSMSLGYGTFNFYLYYGLSSMFKKDRTNLINAETRKIKLGLIFYIL